MDKQSKKNWVCVSCGRGKDEVSRLFTMDSVIFTSFNLCDECISHYYQILATGDGKRREKVISKISFPYETMAILDKYIIGQTTAKEIVSAQIWKHEAMVAYNKEKYLTEEPIERSNLIFIGPTGCGKTLIAQTIEKYTGKPVVVVDANRYTEAGYKGQDIEQIFTLLLIKAKGNLKKAQRGIVFIDEIDKIASKNCSDSDDPSRKAVQQSLLPALQGTTLEIPSGLSYEESHNLVQFDTREILFIASGAFSDLNGIIGHRLGLDKKEMGFVTDKKKVYKSSEILKELTRDDLKKFGLVPEFLGRFHVLVTLDALTVDDLMRILTEPANSVMKEWAKLFKMADKTLEWDGDALRLIAEKASKTNSGARALRGILEEIMHNTIFHMHSNRNTKGYRLTADSIETGYLEEIIGCSGGCGDNCCRLIGKECCGGTGH